MGKRKGRKKPLNTKKYTFVVAKSFQCPFCNHDKVVDCKIETAKSVANLECRVCGAGYQMVTNALTEPIDVYNAWIDECELENTED
mmetsp:Transcript_22115/g.30385  ORF Transcript_22115/g.30385 Transcript_22115/m.30385 type:complete len:86 (+) Transcript_22115:46-303(+)